MKVTGANAIKKDKELVLNPTTAEIILTYPKTLNVTCKTEYNLCLLIIIIILTYLFVYKLLNYTAEFNTIYKKPKTEVIFLALFFVFLFIPMSHTDKHVISRYENRVLAKAPVFITEDKQINYNYTKQFDTWFNDRFNLRNIFIQIYNIKFFINKEIKTSFILKGKDGWLYHASNESIKNYTNEILLTEKELKVFSDYLSEVNNYCKSLNKHFYYVIAPDKESIYPEYYPDYIRKINPEMSLSNQVVNYLNKNTDIKVIYLKDILVQNKNKGLLYYKQDTHWSKFGAYFGYLEIMEEIKKDFKDITVFKPEKYKEEKLDQYDLYSKVLRNIIKQDNTHYKVPYKKINNYKCDFPLFDPIGLVTCQNENQSLTMYSYRDSFTNALISYYAETFKNTKYIWSYKINPEEIKNADIIILETIERFLPGIIKEIEGNNNAV